MAKQLSYIFDGERKTMQFSYAKFYDMYEAVAADQGIDLTQFWAMEKQLTMSCRGQGIVKNFRQKEFEKMGFSGIHFVKQAETDK